MFMSQFGIQAHGSPVRGWHRCIMARLDFMLPASILRDGALAVSLRNPDPLLTGVVATIQGTRRNTVLGSSAPSP